MRRLRKGTRSWIEQNRNYSFSSTHMDLLWKEENEALSAIKPFIHLHCTLDRKAPLWNFSQSLKVSVFTRIRHLWVQDFPCLLGELFRNVFMNVYCGLNWRRRIWFPTLPHHLVSFLVASTLETVLISYIVEYYEQLMSYREILSITSKAYFHNNSTFYNIIFLESGITQYLDPPAYLVLQYLWSNFSCNKALSHFSPFHLEVV